MDAIHPRADRAEHLCPVVEPGAAPALLAVAADRRRDLGGSWYREPMGPFRALRRRMADRAPDHVPDQPLRPVRPAAGVAGLPRAPVHPSRVRHSWPLPVRPAPALRWLAARLLGDPAHDDHAL